MDKRIRVFSASVAAAVMLSAFPYNCFKSSAASVESLQQQYEELQQQQVALQQQISSQNSQLKVETQKKADIQKSIDLTKKQINVLNDQIDSFNNQISSKTQEIEATQKRVDEENNLFKQQLRAMYEAGNVSYLDVLLSAKNVNDFLMKVEVLKSISKYNNNLLTSLSKDKANLQNDKEALQSSMADLQSSEGAMAAKQTILKTQLSKQDQVVEQMSDSVKSARNASAEVAQKAKNTDEELNEEIQKEAAARVKQLAKAEKKANDGDSMAAFSAGLTGSSGVGASYIVKYAEGFLGSPYVFGTAGPDEFDCSGFTQYVFANAAGIYLPHSAAAQSGEGSAVSISNMRAGDLVFFSTNGSGNVSHVGIYIGNDEFIAANNDGVSIQNLFSSAYWSNDFLWARRIL